MSTEKLQCIINLLTSSLEDAKALLQELRLEVQEERNKRKAK